MEPQVPENLHIVCPHCDAVNRVPAVKLTHTPRVRRLPPGAVYR
jgi:thioredoxin 2